MSDDSYVYADGDRVRFDGFTHPFKGRVVGRVNGLGNTYYVQSKEGEVRMYVGSTLGRIEQASRSDPR
jgi:hypothetical protein